MTTSQAQGIHQPLSFLLGNRYTHINFKMKEKWPLDGVEYIPKLFAVGKQRARESYDEIAERFFDHQRERFTPLQTATANIAV